jgi:hypothetical protein
MALIKCKECGAQISDTAAFCPQCGFNETPRGQNIDSATVVVSEDKNGNESLSEAGDKNAGLSAKMLQAWNQFRRGLGSRGTPLNQPSKSITEEQSESDPAEQQESATLPHSPTLAYRLGQILSPIAQFLKVKRNAYISIGVLCLVVGLIGWWSFGEDYSPIEPGAEVERVFTAEELCSYLRDNTKSANKSVDGKIIALSFEVAPTVNQGPGTGLGSEVGNFGRDDYWTLRPRKDRDIDLEVSIARGHFDDMFINQQDSVVYLGGRETNHLHFERRDYWTKNGVPFVDDHDEYSQAYNEDGSRDYDQDSLEIKEGRFVLRVIGICSLEKNHNYRWVRLKRCRITSVEELKEP